MRTHARCISVIDRCTAAVAITAGFLDETASMMDAVPDSAPQGSRRPQANIETNYRPRTTVPRFTIPRPTILLTRRRHVADEGTQSHPRRNRDARCADKVDQGREVQAAEVGKTEKLIQLSMQFGGAGGAGLSEELALNLAKNYFNNGSNQTIGNVFYSSPINRNASCQLNYLIVNILLTTKI